MSDHVAEWNNVLKAVAQMSQQEKLRLIELVVQSLRVPSPAARPANPQASLERLRRELAALPVRNPDDGFRGRDHDRELYGERE